MSLKRLSLWSILYTMFAHGKKESPLSRARRGFYLVELVICASIALLVSGAFFLSVTSSGYTQVKSNVLATADGILARESEILAGWPYEGLDEELGSQVLSFNGYEFVLEKSVSELSVPGAGEVKKISLVLTWKDKFGAGSRGREILRAKPW